MSLAVWHLLILWTTLISRSIMSEARVPYVSEFEYVPGLHPSRNPDCSSRFISKKNIQEDINGWDRPLVEIRAVLSRCSKFSSGLSRRRGYAEDQGITNCTRKIVINMRFNNIGKTETQEKFIVIDHVLDPTTMKKMPLQNPYVIKIRQEAVLQLYGLKFQSVVNAEAREEVINNEDPNYMGCNVDSENPTCGRSFIHGEPVPFSQGFCCSCDQKINAARQCTGCNDTQETSKSSYVANESRNRLPKYDPRAECQDAGSTKGSKPLNSGAGPAGTGVSESNTRREGESIDRLPSMSLRGHKGENNRAADKKEATKSGEKHSRVQGDARSTFVSSTGPEVSSGRPPSGDKTASAASVACVTPTTRENLSAERPGREKPRDHVKTVDKGLSNGDGSVSDRERSNSVKESPKNSNGRNNLRFCDSRTQKLQERSKDTRFQETSTNSSVDLIRSKDTNEQEPKKKRRKKAREKARKGESSSGNKASVTRKRNKAFPVTPTIDSLPIRPAMHLNEPLKNLSTGVLNSNDSPASQPPSSKANLNSVMESTRARSYSETPRPAKKKRKKLYLEDVGLKLLSETIDIERNVLPGDGCFKADKECVRNYTPQKRTLKNLSYRRSNRRRGHRSQRGLNAYRSERSPGRSSGPLRDARRRHRSSRRRRRRRSKRFDDDEGYVFGKPVKGVRVYIDSSRLIQAAEKSRASIQQKAKLKSEGAHDQEMKDELDRRIDEKFSRINDVLKEDLMGPKSNEKEAVTDRTNKPSLDTRLKEAKEGSSLRKNKDAPNREALEEATQPIVEEDDSKYDFRDESDADPYPEAESMNDQLSENRLEESKSPTQSLDLVISPTIGSPLRSDVSSENLLKPDDFIPSDITEALIVVDLFKVGQTETTTRTLKPSNRSVVQKIASFGKSIQKALGFQSATETTHQTFVITGTTPSNTTMSFLENVTELTTTSAATTKITDQAFRPSVKPFKDTGRQHPELHNEIAVDELSFTEDLDAVMTSSSTPVSRRRFGLTPESDQSTDVKRRKKKRGEGRDRLDRSLRGDNSESLGGKDAMKLLFEAANVNLKKKLGSGSSILHEQRSYVQLTMDPNKLERKKYQRRKTPVEVTNSPRINWVHPWVATTETSEYTVKTKNHVDHVLPGKNIINPKKGKRTQKESNSSDTDETSGRILPPCRSRYRRSRRLLSVQSLKNAKSHQQRSKKSSKKVQNSVFDNEGDDYDDSSEQQKNLKTSLKSKKRDTGRSKKKRQNSGKNRSKKQLKSPLASSFEDYYYALPKEHYEVLGDRQADDVDNLEEPLKSEETVPSVDESSGKMVLELQNEEPGWPGWPGYGRLTDNGDAVDFNQLPDDSKSLDESPKDFEISLTGKIHLENDLNGQPVSISFDGAPKVVAKSAIDSDRSSEYADRFSAQSSFADSANVDNINSMSVLAQPADLEEADDQSAPIRSRNAGRYLSHPQRLLRLQKKSVEAIEDADKEEIRASMGLSEDGLEASSKDSGPFAPRKTEAKNNDLSLDSEVPNSAVPSADENAPQVSLDLSDPAEASYLQKNTDAIAASCYALNSTTQKIEMPETTTLVEKMAAFGNTGFYSYQDLNLTTESPTNPRMTNNYENALEETLLPEKQQGFGFSEVESEYNLPPQSDKETAEKKNMQAVAEFVKKLEKLADSGNSTNKTGRTLVHLKKFIIVPDNRTFWRLGKLSSPDQNDMTTTPGMVVVMGEGVNPANNEDEGENPANNEDEGDTENESDQKSKSREAIKEIIRSVINGDDETDKLKEPAAGRKLKRLIGARDTASKGGGSLNTENKNDDRSDERNPQNGNSKNDNDVCKGDSSLKERREAVPSNDRLIRRERKLVSKRKAVDKKRRRKRKRRPKKKKVIKKKKKKKKKNKKGATKWPFKRNLLMLAEEEQIRTSDCGNEWIIDKLSLCGKMKKIDDGNRFREPQIRGGQDCSNRKHPPNVERSKYLESAHCLRFSNLWYSVYRLEEPLIAHRIDLQIYVKRTSLDGSMFWQDLTNGSTIRLGTFDKRYRDQGNTMDFAYNDIKLTSNAGYNLDPAKDRLLIPSTMSGDRAKYPEVEGWSGEYLVVGADRINEDANECDKAGVGFAAFVNQPDRCERVRGTCLKNQPMDYWRHDVEARDSGLAGCYFLSNFGRVPSEAIKYNVNGTGSREFLALEYHSPHVSLIDVELLPDYNALLRAGSYGRLTEVYIDNTAIDYTVITVLITNKGSSSSSYRARITDCPEGLPVSWLNAETPAKTISPHHDRKVALNLYGSLSLNEFSCSVELLNSDGEPIAKRKLRGLKMDRCYCIRHCTCVCDTEPSGCQPMTLEDYHAAGFRGPLPPTPEQPFWFNVISIVCLFIIGLILLLLLLGILKWLVGICVPTVGRWGLDSLLETNEMKEYFEKDLKSRCIVLNELGEPVHPDSKRKSIRVCNRKSEFFLNSIFFFIYPLVTCCSHCMKPQHPCTYTHPVGSKESLVCEKDESPTMICLSTYGDSINSKMEAEDTKYVIDELKKSQESLQNHSRYKIDSETTTIPSSTD